MDMEHLNKIVNERTKKRQSKSKGYQLEDKKPPRKSVSTVTNQGLKAIETVYSGYKFRSRLEARWAIFFESLGIEYQYEREGFDLDGTWYLPDFYLPEQRYWIEIKGQELTEEEHGKCALLAKHNINSVNIFKANVFAFAGEIPHPHFHGSYSEFFTYVKDGQGKWTCRNNKLPGSEKLCWQECPYCRKFYIGSDIGDIDCGCGKKIADQIERLMLPSWKMHEEFLETWINKKRELLYWGETSNLIAAYDAARQARFEHR